MPLHGYECMQNTLPSRQHERSGDTSGSSGLRGSKRACHTRRVHEHRRQDDKPPQPQRPSQPVACDARALMAQVLRQLCERAQLSLLHRVTPTPHPLPSTSGCVEVYSASFTCVYRVPLAAIRHLPSTDLCITRLVRCSQYVCSAPGSCAKRRLCRFVHADCDYAALPWHSIHVNYIWRNVRECTYARLPAGHVLYVQQPHQSVPTLRLRSEQLLVTRGALAYLEYTQQLQQQPHVSGSDTADRVATRQRCDSGPARHAATTTTTTTVGGRNNNSSSSAHRTSSCSFCGGGERSDTARSVFRHHGVNCIYCRGVDRGHCCACGQAQPPQPHHHHDGGGSDTGGENGSGGAKAAAAPSRRERSADAVSVGVACVTSDDARAAAVAAADADGATAATTAVAPLCVARHCAHYFLNRMCRMGVDCAFIHAVYVDPDERRLYQRAPVRFGCVSLWRAARHDGERDRSSSSDDGSTTADVDDAVFAATTAAAAVSTAAVYDDVQWRDAYGCDDVPAWQRMCADDVYVYDGVYDASSYDDSGYVQTSSPQQQQYDDMDSNDDCCYYHDDGCDDDGSIGYSCYGCYCRAVEAAGSTYMHGGDGSRHDAHDALQDAYGVTATTGRPHTLQQHSDNSSGDVAREAMCRASATPHTRHAATAAAAGAAAVYEGSDAWLPSYTTYAQWRRGAAASHGAAAPLSGLHTAHVRNANWHRCYYDDASAADGCVDADMRVAGATHARSAVALPSMHLRGSPATAAAPPPPPCDVCTPGGCGAAGTCTVTARRGSRSYRVRVTLDTCARDTAAPRALADDAALQASQRSLHAEVAQPWREGGSDAVTASATHDVCAACRRHDAHEPCSRGLLCG